MPQRILFKRLKFAYGSAATIIGVLILLAQITIQFALYNEIQTRNLASTMSLQELRSQYLLRVSLMSFNPDNTIVNPLKTNVSQQIQITLIRLEATNKILIDSMVTPLSIVLQINKLQNDFTIMDSAGHQLLIDIQKHNKTDQSKQVTLIFIHEQNYLSGVYATFQALTQQADDRVTQVQLLEIVLCIIALATITFEAFVVVIPAFHDYERALDQAMKEKKQVQQSGNTAS